MFRHASQNQGTNKVSLQAILCLLTVLFAPQARAQWQNVNTLSDLNNWSYQPGFFEWYNHGNHVPSGGYGAGIQLVLGTDNRFGAQLAVPTFEDNLYFRRNVNGVWDNWMKVWNSNNLNTLNTDFNARNLNSNGIIKLINMDNQADVMDNLQLKATGVRSYLESNGDEDGLLIRSNTGNKILLMSKVGIGTETPNEALSVNGNIRAKEIKVEAANWPDYVFEETYQLNDLETVEQYVKVNKHLPGVPDAKTVEKEGMAVGEMNKILLKKLEELTLYVIELKKENESIKKEIKTLKNK